MQMANGIHKLLLSTWLPKHGRLSIVFHKAKHSALPLCTDEMGKRGRVLERSLTYDSSHQSPEMAEYSRSVSLNYWDT